MACQTGCVLLGMQAFHGQDDESSLSAFGCTIGRRHGSKAARAVVDRAVIKHRLRINDGHVGYVRHFFLAGQPFAIGGADAVAKVDQTLQIVHEGNSVFNVSQALRIGSDGLQGLSNDVQLTAHQVVALFVVIVLGDLPGSQASNQPRQNLGYEHQQQQAVAQRKGSALLSKLHHCGAIWLK